MFLLPPFCYEGVFSPHNDLACLLRCVFRVPFGGVKQSGIGREGGAHSIDFYTQQKTVCIKYNSPQYTFV